MARQTKMIIITSDEDIIRQFSFNKTKNTQIIDLDNGNQVISTEKDNKNIINLNLLAQLSELNSNNDQIYKRALDSSDHNRSKPIKVRKKSIDTICVICGDHATGFHYDVLSCASCKAFFRRSAHQPLEKVKCLTGQGQCSVARDIRRKCQRCRLNRCFAMGMRKDFILSEEEKQQRKKCLEENRNFTSKRSSTSESTNSSSISEPLSNSESISLTSDEIDRLLMEMDEDIVLDEIPDPNEMEDIRLEILSVEDWVTIKNIQSSFVSIFQEENIQSVCDDISDRASALISWSQYANQITLRFISFVRQIDEFEGLHADDRFILIKYNLLSLFPIYKCFYYKKINGCESYEDNEEAENRCCYFAQWDESKDICEIFTNLIRSLAEITEQDSTLLSLLLVILIFSQGLSMNENEPLLKDSLAVNRAQSYYKKLLWNYSINKWDEEQACKCFAQLFTIILQLQSAIKRFRDFIRVQCMISNAVDRITPLMQTVLDIY